MSTVVYQYPVSGSTAPTLAQMNGNTTCGTTADKGPHNVVTGTIFMLDADTTAAITHSFGNLFNTQQGEWVSEATKFFPIPIINVNTFSTTSTTALTPQFSVQYTSSVVLTVTKAVSTAGAGTYVFQILRPFQMTR